MYPEIVVFAFLPNFWRYVDGQFHPLLSRLTRLSIWILSTWIQTYSVGRFPNPWRIRMYAIYGWPFTINIPQSCVRINLPLTYRIRHGKYHPNIIPINPAKTRLHMAARRPQLFARKVPCWSSWWMWSHAKCAWFGRLGEAQGTDGNAEATGCPSDVWLISYHLLFAWQIR